MISNSGHDENGKYSNGRAGDQTGKEWLIQEWYSRPWTVILRHTDPVVRETIATLAEQAAKNDAIGYDQMDRYSYWRELKKAKFNPSNIDTPCNADCSAGVAANIKAAGYILNNNKLKDVTTEACTSTLKKILAAAGFTPITDSKHCDSPDYLLRGDILLSEGRHVATNLTDGNCMGKSEIFVIIDETLNLKTTADLMIRTAPDVSSKSAGVIPKGTVIDKVYTRILKGGRWWIRTEQGYLSIAYLSGWIKEDGKWWYSLGNGSYDYYKGIVVKIDDIVYAFDLDGWLITKDRVGTDGSIT